MQVMWDASHVSLKTHQNSQYYCSGILAFCQLIGIPEKKICGIGMQGSIPTLLIILEESIDTPEEYFSGKFGHIHQFSAGWTVTDREHNGKRVLDKFSFDFDPKKYFGIECEGYNFFDGWVIHM